MKYFTKKSVTNKTGKSSVLTCLWDKTTQHINFRGKGQTSYFLFVLAQFAIEVSRSKRKANIHFIIKDCILRRVPEVKLLGLKFLTFL